MTLLILLFLAFAGTAYAVSRGHVAARYAPLLAVAYFGASSLLGHFFDRNKQVLGSFSHDVALSVVGPILGLTVAVILIGAESFRRINIEFDFSEPRIENFVMIDKHETFGRSRTLNLVLRSTAGETDSIWVDHSTFEKFKVGQALTIPVHEGSLGMRWIDSERIDEVQ